MRTRTACLPPRCCKLSGNLTSGDIWPSPKVPTLVRPCRHARRIVSHCDTRSARSRTSASLPPSDRFDFAPGVPLTRPIRRVGDIYFTPRRGKRPLIEPQSTFNCRLNFCTIKVGRSLPQSGRLKEEPMAVIRPRRREGRPPWWKALNRIATRRMREQPWQLPAPIRRVCGRSHRRCGPWARTRTPKTQSHQGYTTRRNSSAPDPASRG